MRVHRTVGLLVMTGFIAACTDSLTEPASPDTDVMFAVAGANPVVGSARGSGHAPCGEDTPMTCSEGGELRTFSFNAQAYADGTASGRAQTNNRQNGNRIKADIDVCVRFFGPANRAWMIGTVTDSNVESGFAVGDKIGFAVSDNGEGSGEETDQIMGIGHAAPGDIAYICGGGPEGFLNFLFDNFFAFDIAGGNVQVQAPEAG